MVLLDYSNGNKRTLAERLIGLSERHRAFSYLFSLALVALTAISQYLIYPDLSIAPFALFFFFCVALSALVAGSGPGLLAVLLSAFVGNFVFMHPSWHFSTSPDSLAGTGTFLFSASGVALLGALFRRSLVKLHNVERSFGEIMHLSPSLICVLRGPDHIVELANEPFSLITGHKDIVGKTLKEALPEIATPDYLEQLNRVYRTGKPYQAHGVSMTINRAPDQQEEVWLDYSYIPMRDLMGDVSGILIYGVDITALRKASITDGLTGAYNHRYLMDSIKTEFTRAERYKDELAFLMLDMDFFKKVNDTYGHQFGDYVLEETSRILRDMIRNVDICARYGGEEFAILMPRTGLIPAIAVAERIGKAIRDHKYAKDGQWARITTSIGVACLSQDTKFQDAGEFIRAADSALYMAKHEGRNTVRVWGGK